MRLHEAHIPGSATVRAEDCGVCGDTPSRYRHAWLRRCPTCGVLSADLPLRIPSEVGEGVLDESARATGLDVLRQRNNARLISAIRRDAELQGQRVLDVGCGPGFFLKQALAAGLAPAGIEPDANVLAAARATGAPVRHGYFPDALEPDERFDVIVFNDVLEHIPALRRTLMAARGHLTPGGLLVVNCPNREGLFYRAAAVLDRLGVHGPYDRLWQRGLPSPHVWYFTPRQLDRALRSVGLRPAGELRLLTVQLDGLWQRIRMVKSTPLPLALSAAAFAVAMVPLARAFPSDARAAFYRRVGDSTEPLP